jgi:hypothetical protein
MYTASQIRQLVLFPPLVKLPEVTLAMLGCYVRQVGMSCPPKDGNRPVTKSLQ